ncbi:Transport system permease protein OS=Tsukamurella paurometabola (strain ATCC 8368 / DSM / CCUG 35730 / CIP 100753 / JCM 10117 / KCTC 9821 / NBRC 16120 /NCIMB 702349 / NCTC 13040) OX=521096 GN=Tpau_1450 PE=3 SV=1 [Tsukamurella paurometabola]|uniref:Transport system permease protein n=1 Tax=Tsukamurella paurometabola (strain ATCC 8368 / DSM 20162 / CCUG 35730 / CIP 100753 / JCM 10117 / KCTC 9821 / NBRC 16120 / NCIMB 702349 / NCTC 13040) TaxID=521096 RepID=D5UXI5_TSUPD|nr:transport system permease protein [Tsukamurella paurometabola DSM 20162]SUP30079.1 Iron-uptake system permease protein FeuC [Tsukamurella paurometabola]
MTAPSRVSGLRPATLIIAVMVLVASTVLGLLVGAADLPLRGVLWELADRLPFVHVDSGLSRLDRNILIEVRLPRVLAAALVGGLLAIAGAGYQGVFRNPLADPYLLGAAAGAGVGATATIALLPGNPAATVPVAAFVGALTGVVLAYLLGSTAGGGGSATLMLAGVAVSAFLGAVQTFLMQLDSRELQRIYSWVLGGVGSADGPLLLAVAPYAAASVLVLVLHGRLLDVLAVGDDEATSLGISSRRVRLVVLVAASLATACAVAIGGLIGFVGIVVPHVVRRVARSSSYRVVLPLSLVGGAAFLEVADVIARTVVAPGELPLGVVTAFVGGPFFVVVLRAMRARGEA